jgi:hypothetical protein
MSYQWVATELLTGVQICDLNDLVVVDALADTIGRYESVQMQLPIPTAPPEWERATMPGATAYWLLQDNPAGGQPLIAWGGYITEPTEDQSDVITMTLATFPAYFDQRYTGDRSYTQTGQNDIVADLIENCVASGPSGGIPMRVQYVGSGVGQLRDHTYADQDDKTVYSALQDMMAWDGGPEWWVGGEWDGQLIKPVLYVGDRIGTAADAGEQPNATFDMPGNLTTFQRVRSFAQGKGANAVMAYSSGQGDVRPQSPVQHEVDPDRPTFEYRWTPSTSILDVDTLTDYAAAALANMRNGSIALALTAIADQPETPMYGADWVLGDDVGYDIHAPAFPGGLAGTARAIGVRLTLGNTRTITPVLAGGDLEA